MLNLVGAAVGCDLLIRVVKKDQQIAACGSSYRGIGVFPTAFDVAELSRRFFVSICRINTIYPVRAAIDCRPLQYLPPNGHD
jgi:hypothetical protein